MREWMEAHCPRLIGALYWPRYRLFSRCWAQGCGRRLMILHSPWALYICERTPMAIRITPKGEAYYQQMVIEAAERDFAA